MSETPRPLEVHETHEALTDTATAVGLESFPLPDRADTFARPLSEADEAALAKRREFADRQAEAANNELAKLSELETPPTAEDWVDTYDSLTQWRSGLDAARLGKGITQSKDRITTSITDASPNRDRIGDLGRLRAGATWSDEAQAWVGGEPTPASRVVAEASERALARFDAEGVEGDELQNKVHLPHGTVVDGNRIVKGETAKQIVLNLKQGVEARGLDVSQFETGGDMMFMVTASEADRAAIFQSAMRELERLSQQPEECSPETLANLAYLLYQSPQNKKGSDAVIRTFLVTAGTYLTGEAPVMRQDVDLRAGTMAQDEFVR